MKDPDLVTYYPPAEERINIFTHALGLVLSVIGLVLLVSRANLLGNIWHVVSFSVFGASMVILYAASTFYHSAKDIRLRRKLNIVDHACIYVFIAGTYTPFTLITLGGTTGWIIFSVVWGLALTGMVLKLFYTGRYQIISTIMYVFMGWVIIFAIQPLIDNLIWEGLLWLFIGGASYTIGAVFFSIDRLKFNHAIFHVLVLIGSLCHFISVFFYVLPEG